VRCESPVLKDIRGDTVFGVKLTFTVELSQEEAIRWYQRTLNDQDLPMVLKQSTVRGIGEDSTRFVVSRFFQSLFSAAKFKGFVVGPSGEVVRR